MRYFAKMTHLWNMCAHRNRLNFSNGKKHKISLERKRRLTVVIQESDGVHCTWHNPAALVLVWPPLQEVKLEWSQWLNLLQNQSHHVKERSGAPTLQLVTQRKVTAKQHGPFSYSTTIQCRLRFKIQHKIILRAAREENFWRATVDHPALRAQLFFTNERARTQ